MGDLLDSYPRLGDRITTARQAGYSDEEIQGHLQDKMHAAFKAGYTPDEVNAYLGEIKQPSIMEPIAATGNEILRQATPDTQGVIDSFTHFGEERNALENKLRPALGASAEGTATVAQAARTIGSIPMAIVPRGITEGFGQVMDLVKQGSEKVLGKVLPKDITDVMSEFMPDVMTILGGSYVHGALKRSKGSPLQFVEDASDAVMKQAKDKEAASRALDQLKAAADTEGQGFIDQKLNNPVQEEQFNSFMERNEPKPPPTAEPVEPQPPPDMKLNAEQVVDRIESQQNPKFFDRDEITDKVEKGGDTYVKTEVPVDELTTRRGVKPGDSVPDKGAIVADDEGKVIDGNHRTVDAKANGEKTIEAYVPEDSKLAPRFEKTAAGDQAVLPGSPIEREIPSGGLKAERPQTEAMTDLERATVPDTQEKLPTAKAKPRQILEDTEVRPSTFIQRQGGIKIPKELKEEFGGWNRLNNKNGLPADEMAELMYEHGLIERPDTNALLDALKSGKKSARSTADLSLEADIDRHVKGLQQSETGVEYKGHTYDSVEPEGPNKFRLKDDPDKVIPRNKVVEVEEKVPFDIPDDPVQERIKALEAENAKLQKKVQPAKVEGEASAGSEAVPAKKSVKEMTFGELAKKGLGSERGSVGYGDEGMQQIEADAREARREMYLRMQEYARDKGISLNQAARDHKVLQRDMAALRAEATQQGWNQGGDRKFSPLEKEMGKDAGEPKIFEPIPDPFKGSRLSTETTKAITDAAFEAYKASGRKIDKDIPITIQVARDLAEGNLDLSTLQAELAKRGTTLKEFGEGLLATESNAGRQLQQMSALKQKLRDANIQIGDFKPEPPSAWSYAGDLMHRWLNIWRGALVTQLGTAVRNLESQSFRQGIDAIEKVVDGTIQQMFRVGPGHEEGLSRGFGNAIEDLVDLAKKGKRNQADNILSVFPKQRDSLFYQFAGDVNRALHGQPMPEGKIAGAFERITRSAETGIEYANVLNQGQEFLIRRAAFRAKLADLLERKGQDIDNIDPRAIDEKDVAASVDHALEMTFAQTPHKGVGKWILDAYKAIPPLYFIAPFPKFMWNSWKFISDYSPTGFVKLLSSSERAKLAAGDTKTLSRAIIGTGMLGAAYMLRNSEYAGEKWYEIQIGDRTLDTRPYNPFASYLFVADVVNRWNKGTLDQLGFKDLTQGLLSANFRAGTGLFMLDTIGDVVGGLISNQGAPETGVNTLKRAAGETLAGFLTPFQTFKDILSDERLLGLMGQEDFAHEEAKMRDVRDQPFLGPMMAKLPGVSQQLPETQFPVGSEEGNEKEEPGARQLTGLMFRTKTPVQHEADRLGLQLRDLETPTGIVKLDRDTAEIMRPVAERTLTALMGSQGYQQAPDEQKRIWFKKWIHEIGNGARQQAMANDRDLRLEYMIKRAGKDQGKLLRETFVRRGLMAE